MGYTVLVILILYIPVRSYTVYVNVWSTVVLSNLALRRSFSAYFWNWYNSRRVHRQLLCSWTAIDARNMRSWWLIRSHIPTPMVLLYAFCIVHRDFTMFVTTAARFKSFGPNLKFLQHLRSHCLVRLSTSWGLDDRSRHVSCELVTVHMWMALKTTRRVSTSLAVTDRWIGSQYLRHIIGVTRLHKAP